MYAADIIINIAYLFLLLGTIHFTTQKYHNHHLKLFLNGIIYAIGAIFIAMQIVVVLSKSNTISLPAGTVYIYAVIYLAASIIVLKKIQKKSVLTFFSVIFVLCSFIIYTILSLLVELIVPVVIGWAFLMIAWTLLCIKVLLRLERFSLQLAVLGIAYIISILMIACVFSFFDELYIYSNNTFGETLYGSLRCCYELPDNIGRTGYHIVNIIRYIACKMIDLAAVGLLFAYISSYIKNKD